MVRGPKCPRCRCPTGLVLHQAGKVPGGRLGYGLGLIPDQHPVSIQARPGGLVLHQADKVPGGLYAAFSRGLITAPQPVSRPGTRESDRGRTGECWLQETERVGAKELENSARTVLPQHTHTHTQARVPWAGSVTNRSVMGRQCDQLITCTRTNRWPELPTEQTHRDNTTHTVRRG